MQGKEAPARSKKVGEFMARGLIASLLGMFVMACSGCGGGGGASGTPEASTQVAAPTPKKPVSIDAEGDSLIWGYQGVNASGQMIQSVNAPPVVLQATLQAQLGNGVTVINNAVPGSTVLESLNGTTLYTTPFATRLMSIPSQIVLTDYAANDIASESLADYTASLQTWVDTVRAYGKVPVLEEPNPSCKAVAVNLGQYVQAMDQVAQQRGVLLIQQYQYVLSLPNWQSMLLDCTHPNDALYKAKALREAAALAPLVQSLQ